MPIQRSLLGGAFVAGLVLTTHSQILAQKAQKTPATPAKPAAASTGDVDKAIHETAQHFVDAFNKGDAKAVASLWTEDGDYVDEAGDRISGREAIEKKYAAFFADNPGAKIEVVVESVHQLSPDTATEDGHAKLTLAAPHSSAANGRYMAVHVKRDGKWLMASVRDMPQVPTAGHDPMDDLDWMVGAWHAEYLGVETTIECRWLADKSFVEATYTKKDGDKVTPIATHIIGVDPQSGQIMSWMFNSDRSFAQGAWIPHDSGWIIESDGMSADGAHTSAVNILSRVEDVLVWKSTNRAVAGMPVPDTQEVVLKRKKSTH